MSTSKKPAELRSFLYAYFFQLERELNKVENDLSDVKFQSEEANTDEHLKKYFKDFILTNNKLETTSISNVVLRHDEVELTVPIEQLQAFQITNVYLPEDLNDSQKAEIAKHKSSVYTNPDLYLEITDGINIYFESIELKSTKNNNIPGSSVQQVSPFEWVIFIKRNPSNVSVTTGYYINSITEKLPFPDRSPRPQIGFNTLTKWNNQNRTLVFNTLIVESSSSENEEKLKLLKDWQDYLASEWMDIIKSNRSRPSEKWFNNALRKFAIKFLDYTESLSPAERERLRNVLDTLIR